MVIQNILPVTPRYYLILLLSGFLFADESWRVYDDSQIAIINITIDPEDLEWMYDNVESDSIHLATVQFQNTYIDEFVDSIGFRLRGNTSRVSEKKSFKVDFNHFISGRDFYGVEKLNLNGEHNDPSIVRSKLCWDFFQDIGMVSSRAAHVKLYINNEYFGLYISVEHIDDTFLSKHFNNDNGNLWKCLWPADLTYRGDDPEDYHPYYDETRPYELKTNTNDYDYSKLARLIRVIHETPDSLDLVLDIKETLQYLAMNTLTGSWDDYRFLRNNFYLYHDPSDGLIHLIPYDYDNTFSIDWFDLDWSTIDPYDYAVIDNDGRPLTDYIFSQARYRNLFSHFLQFYNNKLFKLDSINSRLDYFVEHLYESANEDVYRTLDYGFSIDDFVNSYGENFQFSHVKKGLKEFILNRKTSINNQIVFENDVPIIYEAKIGNNIIIVGDTVNISASLFGEPLNVHFFYLREGEDNWQSTILTYAPDTMSSYIEDHDNWYSNFIIDSSGTYYWYIFANSDEGSDRYPVYDYASFQVIDEVYNQPVFINELLAKNETINNDEAGEFDDWVEIWNYSSITVDLSNHYLTDKIENLTKWKFPDSNSFIEPNEFILIWCDEDQEQGPLHSNFKLSSNGEFLALVLPDGITIMDSISFPIQSEDISYGRSGTANDEWVYMPPSPGDYNEVLSINDDPLLSSNFKLSNIYPNPFNSTFQIEVIINSPLKKIKINLISLTGRTVYSKVVNDLQTGHKTVTIKLNQLISSGSYFLKIESPNQTISRKIIYIK